MSGVASLDRSIGQIQQQKRKILQSVGHYKGNKGMVLNRLADKDLGGYLTVAKQSK